MTIYDHALEFLQPGTIIGLGSGRAASAFIEKLGERVRAGFDIKGVPTSRASEQLARKVGIPLVSLHEGMPLALTVDGADEVDPSLDLIKGYGRALVREKVVAASSEKLIILVGKDKLVGRLGERGKLPVEVTPFALPLVHARLMDLELNPVVDQRDGVFFLTDNGNHILDCQISPIADAVDLDDLIRAIPGVVGTGLFLAMADLVLVGDQEQGFAFVEERTPPV